MCIRVQDCTNCALCRAMLQDPTNTAWQGHVHVQDDDDDDDDEEFFLAVEDDLGRELRLLDTLKPGSIAFLPSTPSKSN